MTARVPTTPPRSTNDLFPLTTAFESVKAVRVPDGADPDDYDLDNAWWLEEEEADGPTYEERMAAAGFVQMWDANLGMRVWRLQ